MATKASNKIKYLLATGAVNAASDEFDIVLMASGFTYDEDADDDYADISANELPTGNGYTAGGAVLAGVAVTRDDVNDWTSITWNNMSWTASGGPIGPVAGAAIFDNTHIDKPIVGYIDFGGDQTQADGGVATVANPEVRVA